MKMFKKVAIVGTGLIGGSIALDIKKKGLAREVVGVSRHRKSLRQAEKIGAIDRGSQKLEIIKGADLVILATPPEVILRSVPALKRLVDQDCIVTDVASTKEKVVSVLAVAFANFVGTHPLAGSEKKGIDYASSGIFRGSLCLVTPSAGVNARALNKVRSLWKHLGARTIILKPALHDRILSFTSHLPHIAAFSLINSVPPGFLKFSAGGLKDTTRLASSDAVLWADIFLTNRKNILSAVGSLQGNLARVKSALAACDRKKLIAILRGAGKKRAGLSRL